MNNISLGRYMPYNSVIHKMDPRCKLIGLIFLMVSIFISYDTFGMTMLMYGILGLIIQKNYFYFSFRFNYFYYDAFISC